MQTAPTVPNESRPETASSSFDASALERALRLPRDAREGEILETVRRHGVAVLPEYLDRSLTQTIRDEALKLLDAQANAKSSLKTGASRVARVERAAISPTTYPSMTRLFASPPFERIARAYYEPHRYVLNEKIYVTHDVSKQEFNEVWHIDPMRSLKFYFYLSDTGLENGPLSYAPGSHREGYYRALYYRRMGDAPFPQHFPDDELPLVRVALTAPAGTLIVFEGLGVHRAAPIAQGAERLVVRGHTYHAPSRLQSRLRSWLLRSPLNLAKYRLCFDDCFSDEMRTRAVVPKF